MTSLLMPCGPCHIRHVCWHYKSVYFIVTCHRQRSAKLSRTYANAWMLAFRPMVYILSILCKVSTNLTEQISRRFQEGFQEKSRTCLHCFGLLCNVTNLLVYLNIEQKHDGAVAKINKKAQLSLTNPRDAKVCQKLLQFDVLTTLSLTILAYLHAFSCCCVRNLRNPAKFTENSNLWSSRSSNVIDLGVNRKPRYDFLLVTNSNFGRISYRFRDIDA